jgi:hypothetical protein
VVAAAVACRGERARATAFPIPGSDGARVTVEVLNASGKPGLAKSATRVLREAGIDVVTFGNAPQGLAPLDTTAIVLRRGAAAVGAAAAGGAGTAVARRIRAALGVGRVTVALDTTRLLDASVLLGADFAPSLKFHP